MQLLFICLEMIWHLQKFFLAIEGPSGLGGNLPQLEGTHVHDWIKMSDPEQNSCKMNWWGKGYSLFFPKKHEVFRSIDNDQPLLVGATKF
jgi:hypothetical protein